MEEKSKIENQSEIREPKSEIRLGVFGGSFDPIHHGHLILAREALEQLELDRVIFVPAAVSPHKIGNPPRASAAQRLRMVQLAIESEPYFEVDDCELRRGGPSYTIDTVHWMHRRFPEAMFTYFVGSDHVSKLDTWKDSVDLRKMVTFVVLARGPVESGIRVIHRSVEISSTEIRKRVAAGRSIRYLVPGSVCRFILEGGIYRNE